MLNSCACCKKLFTKSYNSLFSVCPNCQQAEQEQFQKVCAYLREHPGTDVIEIAANTEIDKETVLRYFREGKLHSFSLKDSAPACKRCTKPLKGNERNMCDSCTGSLTGQFKASRAAGEEHALRQKPTRSLRSQRYGLGA